MKSHRHIHTKKVKGEVYDIYALTTIMTLVLVIGAWGMMH